MGIVVGNGPLPAPFLVFPKKFDTSSGGCSGVAIEITVGQSSQFVGQNFILGIDRIDCGLQCVFRSCISPPPFKVMGFGRRKVGIEADIATGIGRKLIQGGGFKTAGIRDKHHMFSPLGVGKSYARIKTIELYLIAFKLGTQALKVIAYTQSEETETPFHFVEKTQSGIEKKLVLV